MENDCRMLLPQDPQTAEELGCGRTADERATVQADRPWIGQLRMPACPGSAGMVANAADTLYVSDGCPELDALVHLLGTAEAADGVALLLIEATLGDVLELDRSLESCDLDRAAQRLHRIVGGYQVLGPSPLMEEGRALLSELRTCRNGATLVRLARFRGRLLALTWRIEAAVNAGRLGMDLS